MEADETTDFVYTPMVKEFTDDKTLWQKGRDDRQLSDRRDGSVYRMHPRVRLAVDVALAAGRPLLLRGEPGSGKSSIPSPTKDSLTAIARLHISGPGSDESDHDHLFEVLADKLLELRGRMARRDRPPGVAEYLDAVQACIELEVDPSEPSATWEAIEEFTLRKPTDTA